MSGMASSLKMRWAWNLAPYYKQALEDGAVDAFFGRVFTLWLEHFPLPLEDFEGVDCWQDAVEAEKKVFWDSSATPPTDLFSVYQEDGDTMP
jgi:hypothetical protein